MIGKAFFIHFPAAGEGEFSVSDEGGKNWRRMTDEEKRGPINDALDAFVLSLIEAGELERIHTEDGERPYLVERDAA